MLLAAGSTPLFAQAGASRPGARVVPTVKPVRTATPPAIDGRLDDPVWKTAAHLSNFVQRKPLDGAPASEPTDVFIAYDNDFIYFGIHAHYSEAALVRANRVDRDQIWNDDRVSVMFDPFRDQQRGYRFAVNGYGVQGDALMANTSTAPGDTSWNVLFTSAGVLADDGWTAEFSVPFKSLRYPGRSQNEPHRWGLQVERDIVGKDENVVWAPISRDVMSELGQMGDLDGMTNLSTSRNLELLPTVTAIHAGRPDAAGAFDSDVLKEAGINLKYGLNSNLTFDFTYNPDFSQIESDRQQVEVNQRFPVLYPELRPFFLEGQEIFRVPGPVTFIHTRTIVDPQFGAKLSGKVGRTTVGLLVANDEAPGKVEPSNAAYTQTAKFVIGRARYDLYRESTTSVIFTDREFMNEHSRAVGADGDFALGLTHRFFARVILTDHRDAAGVKRKGYFYDFNLRKTGRNFGYSAISNAISPDLRTDAGFVRRTDQRQTVGNLSYRWWPGNYLVNWGPRVQHSRNYQFNRTLQEEINFGATSFTFARNISAEVSVNRDMERYRGIDFWKTRYSVSGTVASSKRISVSASTSRGDQIRFISEPFLGAGNAWEVVATLKPLARLQSEWGITTSRFVDRRTSHEEFDVKIVRILSTYQFTNRLLVRNITAANTFDGTFGENVLLTYRVNAGTVFFLGYDDRYKRGDQIDAVRYTDPDYRRTNRAVFTKLQYLLRYGS